MSSESTISNLIRSISQKDPALYSALQLIVKDLYAVYGEVFPAGSASSIGGLVVGTPGDIAGFDNEAFPTNLRLTWDLAINSVQYEIRKGNDWDTALFVLRTNQLVANVDPIILNLVYGNHEFLIKGINSNGIYSVNAASTILSVPVIGSPSLSGSGIANNALLSWSAPLSTWRISYYEIYKDSVKIGEISANFMISSELIGGTYNYSVKAVDIVGNVSDESPAVELVLEDPIDLVFIDTINASLTGTYSNTALTTINNLVGVIGPVDDSETYEDHFLNNLWNTPQDQIDAGYPYYIQPIPPSGYYEEEFDFGFVLNNVTIVVGYSKLNLVGNVSVEVQISYSEDGIIWSTPVVGIAALANAVRYVLVRWTITNLVSTDFGFLHGLRCSISTQLILDSGSGFANAGDAGGTVITMNKTYKAVNSVTLTSNSLEPITLIFDDVGTNTFKVFAFDTSGNRISTDFGWKTRGIV